jgi:hypothetical protein
MGLEIDSMGEGSSSRSKPANFWSRRGPGAPRTFAVVIGAVIFSAILVVATLHASSVAPRSGPLTPPPGLPPGWTTFDNALSTVQAQPTLQRGGPWGVTLVEGAAANVPWSPEVWQWYGEPQPICGIQSSNLTGISAFTYWNSSLFPAWDSPLALTSGWAPLWSFVFQNSTGVRVISSWFNGTIFLNAVAQPTPRCFETNPQVAIPSEELDSPLAAAAAQHDGASTLLSSGRFHTAFYFPVGLLLPWGWGIGGSLPMWQVAYSQCESHKYHGGSYLEDFGMNSTTGQGEGATGGAWYPSCFDTSYTIGLNNTSAVQLTSPDGGRVAANISYITEVTSVLNSPPTLANLTTNQTQISVTTPYTEINLSSAAAVCRDPSENLSGCTAPASGWYAVLASPGGHWLDSYPSLANGTSWVLPEVQIALGDEIEVFTGPNEPLKVYLYLWPSSLNPYVFGGAELSTR